MKCIEDEIPFEVPEGWEWCRLKSIAAAHENSFVDGPFGSNLKTDHYTENKEVRIIQLNNIGDLEWKNSGVKYTTFEHAESLSRCKSYPGDIVIAKMMPAGRTIIIPDIENIYVISSDCVRLQLPKYVFNKYIMLMINSNIINAYITENVQGIGRSRTSLSKLKELLIPLPPLKEQMRIVNKADILLKQLVNININVLDIKSLINDTKAKILDLAIRGKLVPQDPNDEPASVLLERIRAEKEELIKQGKIKRDKKESVIFKGEDNSYYETINGQTECIDDDIPFELPDNWTWARLSNVVQILNGDRGQNYPAKNKLQKSGIPFVSASNIESGRVSSQELLCMTDEQYNVLGSGKLVPGDIVYCIRGSLGKCGIFEMEKGAIASSLVIVRPIITNLITTEYIFNYLSSNLAKKEITKYDNGSAQPNLAAKDFMRFLIPIPPSNEQTLINNLLDKLYFYINYIESSLL